MGARAGNVVTLRPPAAEPEPTQTERERVARVLDRFDQFWSREGRAVRDGIRRIIADSSARDRLRAHEATAAGILDLLNRKIRAGTRRRGYAATPANLKLICARLDEGIAPEDLRAVVALKWRQARDPDHYYREEWCNPATLFRPSKCPLYLAELERTERTE